jgi:hypothetical protein
MTTRKTFSAIGDFFSTFGSAVAVSRAVNAGRKPRSRDLRILGIDPARFDTIRRF